MNTKYFAFALVLLVGIAVVPLTYAQQNTQPDQPRMDAERIPRVKKALDLQRAALTEFNTAMDQVEGTAVQPEVRADAALRSEVRLRMEEARAAMARERLDIKAKLKIGLEEPTELIAQRRAEAKEIIDAARESFRLEFEARKEQAAQLRAERKAIFDTKVKEITDTKKQEIALRVDATLEQINENRVAFFTNAVDQIERVLDMIESRTDKAEASGKEVATVRTAIKVATDAIVAARASIAVQAGNTYTAEISAETTLRSDFTTTRDALRADLVAVRTAVQAAHAAVRDAAVTLGRIPGIDEVAVEASSTTNL